MDIEQLTLVDICEQVLIRQGPTAVPELVQAVRNAGIDPGPDAAEVVMDALSEPDTAAVSLTDERWAWGPDLLLGRVFTHRLSAEEIEHDLVAVNPDLAALLALDLLPEFARLADQTPVEVGFGFGTGVGAAGDDGDDEGEDPGEGMTGVRPCEAYDVFGSLELPLGTLSGYVAGDLLGLRMTDAGIELSTVAEDIAGEDAAGEDATGHAVAAGQHLQRVVVSASEKPVTVESAVLTVCAEEAERFTAPLPPVAELIGAVGLAHEADFLAEPGFDFRAASVARRVSHVAETYELDEDEALSVVALRSVYQRFDDVLSAANEMVAEQGTDAADGLQALFDTESGSERQVEPGQPGTTVGKLVPLLAEPAVAYALLAETLGDEDEGAATLGLMAETLEEQAERPARPALRWLRARAHERLGEILKAEQVLQASERAQPGWPPILLDLARYAADRSDATGALELLDRLGPDAPPGLVEVVRRFQPEPGPVLGRNQPCWCGSGRKFKQCHLHRVEQRPLEERAAWLYEKARWYVSEGPWQPLLLEAATERAAYARTEEEVRRRTLDPFVTDAVLFEGGAFEEFVEVRGPLLPDDERLLAQQWLLVDRSAFEVTKVERGQGYSVRDLRTGDHHEVRDASVSRELTPGLLICARVVPVGEQMQVFGGIEPIARHDRDALLELLDRQPDPDELVAFCSRRFAPPTLVNTDQDLLVACEGVLRTDDADRLAAALNQAFETLPDTEPAAWVYNRMIEGMNRVCASMVLRDDELTVSTNSTERMTDILARLRDLDPTLVVIDEEREPIRTPEQADRLLAQLPASTRAGDPEQEWPEIEQAMAQQMQAYEREWLDVPLPALAGRTPRQAADDPTRRDDLIELLASFPETEEATQMSPGRLRQALGLVG